MNFIKRLKLLDWKEIATRTLVVEKLIDLIIPGYLINSTCDNAVVVSCSLIIIFSWFGEIWGD